MEATELRCQLQALQSESFGWALCCCARDADRAADVLQIVYLKVLDGKAAFDVACIDGICRMSPKEQIRQAGNSQFGV